MEQITMEKCDVMMAGIIVFAHSIEKFMRVVEEYYIQRDMQTPEFKKMVDNLFTHNLISGMSRQMAYQTARRNAESILRNSAKEELECNGPLPYKKFLEQVRQVIDMVDEFTEVGMADSIPKEGENLGNIYDYMQGDADRMCRVFCRFNNIDGKDENAERAIRRYETKGLLSEEFMDKWFRTQGVEPEKPKRKKK